MQIYGIGTDIVQVSRIKKIWEQYGLKFAKKILSIAEHDQLTTHKQPEYYLAKRFAAKEAVAKALGTGFNSLVKLTEITIVNKPSGQPEVKLSGDTQLYASTHGKFKYDISISDERDYVVAFVVISC